MYKLQLFKYFCEIVNVFEAAIAVELRTLLCIHGLPNGQISRFMNGNTFIKFPKMSYSSYLSLPMVLFSGQ